MKHITLLIAFLAAMGGCRTEKRAKFVVTVGEPTIEMASTGGEAVETPFVYALPTISSREYVTSISMVGKLFTSLGQMKEIPEVGYVTRDLVSVMPVPGKATGAPAGWDLSLKHIGSSLDDASFGKANVNTVAYFEKANALKAMSTYRVRLDGFVSPITITGVRDANNQAHNACMPHHLQLGLYALPKGPLRAGMVYTITNKGAGRRSAGSKPVPSVTVTIKEVSKSRVLYMYEGRRFHPGALKVMLAVSQAGRGIRIADFQIRMKGYTEIDLEKKHILSSHGEYGRLSVHITKGNRRASATVTTFHAFSFAPKGARNTLPGVTAIEVQPR